MRAVLLAVAAALGRLRGRPARAALEAALFSRAAAECLVDSNVTCLVDSGCPGGPQNMTCTKPQWWTTVPPVLPTEPPLWVNVTMVAECSYMATDLHATPSAPVLHGAVDNSSGIVPNLMPASPGIALAALRQPLSNGTAATYPCNVTKYVLKPPEPPPAPTAAPPLVPGRCFCRKGCWNAGLQRCLTWEDAPPVAQAVPPSDYHPSAPLEQLHTDWHPKHVGPFGDHPYMPPGGCDEAMRGAFGSGYRGCARSTRDGKECAKWSLMNQVDPSIGLGPHDFCRNPNAEHDSIWCWTKVEIHIGAPTDEDVKKKFEFAASEFLTVPSGYTSAVLFTVQGGLALDPVQLQDRYTLPGELTLDDIRTGRHVEPRTVAKLGLPENFAVEGGKTVKAADIIALKNLGNGNVAVIAPVPDPFSLWGYCDPVNGVGH